MAEVSHLIQKYRHVVKALHFKTMVLEDEISASENKAALRETENKLAETRCVHDQFHPQFLKI